MQRCRFCWLLVTGLRQDYETDRSAIEQGYIQQTLPGTTGVYWVKDREVLE